MIRRQSVRAVRPSGGPVPDDAHHDPPVRPRQPPSAPAWSAQFPRDAYALAKRYETLRLEGRNAAAEVVLRHLEMLAARAKPREGEHDEPHG